MKLETALATIQGMKLQKFVAAPRDNTFIYFFQVGDFVKIGRSRRWKERIAEMQTGSPHTIVPLLVFVGDVTDERGLHRRFHKYHFRGEWFHLSLKIKNYIETQKPKCMTKSDLDRIRVGWENVK